MPQLNNLQLEIDADAVLRAQGGDPEAIRARRPEFAELAEYALGEAQSVLEPRVIYERLEGSIGPKVGLVSVSVWESPIAKITYRR